MFHPKLTHSDGFAMQVGGTVLLWLEHHGLGLVGLLSILFGMWVQWKTYRLRVRELALKEREAASPVRLPLRVYRPPVEPMP